MLVIEDNLRRHRRADDDGAMLITVVLVMLVGFIVTATIAASVVFAIGDNVTNKDRTQAFISAESGRDAVLAKLVSAACSTDPLSPNYGFAAANANAANGPLYSATALVDNGSGLVAACPSKDTKFLQIVSEGTGTNDATVELNSQYGWTQPEIPRPGGTMTYFSGQFKATKANYTGDIVIREGDFLCNSGGGTVIDGDLWVPQGEVNISSNCTINGSIYAKETITISSSSAVVTGDLAAEGNISITANKTLIGDKALNKGGNVYTNGTLNLDSKAEIVGKFVTGGAATAVAASVGKFADSVQNCATTSPLPAKCNSNTPATSMFDPTLEEVLAMTQWLDLPAARSTWGSGVQWSDATAAQCTGGDVRPTAMATLTSPNTKRGIDFTNCTGTGAITVNVASGLISHDVVFIVPPKRSMAVKVGTLTPSPVGVSPTPQVLFVHGDNGELVAGTTGNAVPECGSGSADDSIDITAATTVRLMIYSPCGLGMANHTQFTGQYYANDDGNARWVQPTFRCEPMKWPPVALGCTVKGEATGGEEPPVTSPGTLGGLISQTEN